MPQITIAAAETFMEDALARVDVPADHALQVGEVILDSELRGHPDHGLFFFRAVVNWYKSGLFKLAPNTRVVRDTTLCTTIDGDNGCGVIGMNEAIELSIAKARSHGMAAASVTNSGNVIALAPFVQRAADQGLIAFACSGFRYPLVPPVGGLSVTFGTNPIAYAAPAGKHFPFLLDMSTSAVAVAKIFEAAANGESIPAGLAETSDGRPLTNASEFQLGSSLILPVGGVKGFGLMMMVDVFANVMGDSEWGHFLWLLDPGQFQSIDRFTGLMDEEIDRIKNGKRKPGVEEIFYPGERGQKRMARLREEGVVPLEESGWSAMQSVSEDLAVDMPAPID